MSETTTADPCQEVTCSPALQGKLANLAEMMTSQQVTLLTVDYSGSGDEGDFYSATSEGEGEADTELENLCGELAAEMVDLRYSGFQNDAGGSGTVTFTVGLTGQKIKAVVDHNANCEATEYDEVTYFMRGISPKSQLPDKELRDIRKIRKFMESNTIGSITVQYSGSGDEGDYQEPSASEGEVIPSEMISLISQIAETAVEKHYSGWENNEGASGSVVFYSEHKDTDDFAIIISHGALYETSETDSYCVIIPLETNQPV